MADSAAEVDAIADLVNRVTLDRINPERFHQQRDEIAKRLRAIARDLRGDVRRKPSTTWRADGKQPR
jgi:hypothetical protein